MPLSIVSTSTRDAAYSALLLMLKGKLDIPADDDFKDAELHRLVKSSVATVERDLRRTLLTRSYRLDTWGFHDIRLPKPPLASVTHVKYYDSADDLQTLSADAYALDGPTSDNGLLDPPVLWFRDDDVGSLILSTDRPFPLQVTYAAGYGDAYTDWPDDLLEGVLLLAYHRFRSPEACHGSMPAACLHYLGPFYHKDGDSTDEVGV